MHALLTSKNLVLALLLLLATTTLFTFVLRVPRSSSPLTSSNDEIKVSKWSMNPNNIQQVSAQPRVFVYRGLLSPEECDHIIEIGETKLQRSMVVGANGKAVVDSARTSYGAFLAGSIASDPVLQALTERIEQWSHIPRSHGEDFYLLRYQIGQEYKPHHDYFDPETEKKLGRPGNRVATALIYLSDVEEGGETYFPRAVTGEIKVPPHKGDAVLFFDYTPANEPDQLSLHGGKPVIQGTKWSLTRWMRMRSIR